MQPITKQQAEELRLRYHVVKTRHKWYLSTEDSRLHQQIHMQNKQRNRHNVDEG